MFSPNFITKLVTTAAILPILVAPAPANADSSEGQINGYQVTVIDSGRYDAADSITVWGPGGVETITVTCAPFNWRSYGANTEQFVDSIARGWCF